MSGLGGQSPPKVSHTHKLTTPIIDYIQYNDIGGRPGSGEYDHFDV